MLAVITKWKCYKIYCSYLRTLCSIACAFQKSWTNSKRRPNPAVQYGDPLTYMHNCSLQTKNYRIEIMCTQFTLREYNRLAQKWNKDCKEIRYHYAPNDTIAACSVSTKKRAEKMHPTKWHKINGERKMPRSRKKTHSQQNVHLVCAISLLDGFLSRLFRVRMGPPFKSETLVHFARLIARC